MALHNLSHVLHAAQQSAETSHKRQVSQGLLKRTKPTYEPCAHVSGNLLVVVGDNYAYETDTPSAFLEVMALGCGKKRQGLSTSNWHSFSAKSFEVHGHAYVDRLEVEAWYSIVCIAKRSR